MAKRFILQIDPTTVKALAKLAKAQEMSRAAIIRKLVKEAAKELNGTKPVSVASAPALALKVPTRESEHAAAIT